MSPSALRRQIGQLLIAGFDGHQVPPELRSLAREFGLGMAIRAPTRIFELPLVEDPPDRLRRVQFVPCKAAIAAGVAATMTAHVLVPSLDEKRPGTERKLTPVTRRV